MFTNDMHFQGCSMHFYGNFVFSIVSLTNLSAKAWKGWLLSEDQKLDIVFCWLHFYKLIGNFVFSPGMIFLNH